MKKYWSDPVWSKVIASVLVTLLGGIGSYFLHLWPMIRDLVRSIWTIFVSRIPVPVWIFIPMLIFVVWRLLACLWGMFIATKPSDNPIASAPDPHSYTEDYFFGLRWRWSWDYGFQPSNLSTFCPSCDLEIEPVHVSGFQVVPRFAYYCESCQRRMHEIEEVPQDFEDRVKRFIQQKVRTGTWVDSLAKP